MAPLWVQTILFLLLPVCKHLQGYFKACLRFIVFLQDELVTLQNPADVPIYVQVLPLALMPNPSVFSGKLADRWDLPTTAAASGFLSLPLFLTLIFFWFPRLPLGNMSNINIDTNTLEFQVHRNQVSAASVIPIINQAFRESAGCLVITSTSSPWEAPRGSGLPLTGLLCVCQTSLTKSNAGFIEGSTRPFVYNLLLQPGEVKSFNVRFTPISNRSVSSLLIVR